MEKHISILYPENFNIESLKALSYVSWHDLGMDLICNELSRSEEERSIVRSVMMNLSDDPALAAYRTEIFEDIYRNPAIRTSIMELLNKIKNLQDYMSTGRNLDKADSIWTLTRRLKEIYDYIICIEALEDCLSASNLKSEGLLNLRDYVHAIQSDCYFAELKKDIAGLKENTMKVKSVTLGINLNENYDALSVGVVSLNDKEFSEAPLLSSFAKRIGGGDQIQTGSEWDHKMSYHELSDGEKGTSTLERTMLAFTSRGLLQRLYMGMSTIHKNTSEEAIMEHTDEVVNRLLSSSVKALKQVLSKYASVNIFAITALIPEFVYYITWADYMEKLEKEGYLLSKAEPFSADGETANYQMKAIDIYNLKLAAISHSNPDEIIKNNLDFSDEHTLYILTGANRGGKTTITQTIGQLFVLAQGGIYIPGKSFAYMPVDGIHTHFPADEDKTLDFGRLGEECARFKEMYQASTSNSLLLLNESFSTTSFEEGYYIAYDAIRAILKKGIRTIFNTHMHKLGRETAKMNETSGQKKAASIIVKTEENGKRSYKVQLAEAENSSYAADIARKYGVTFEQLTAE